MRPIYLFLLPLLLTLGCDAADDDDSEIPLVGNTFIAKKDNNLWNGTTELNLMENDTLIFLGVGEGLDNGVVVVKVKFVGTGTYEVEKEKAFYYDTLGGDAIIAQYTLQEPEKATFIVDSYNETQGTVTGTFSLELFPETNGGKSIESFLRITEGQFSGTIVQNPTQ